MTELDIIYKNLQEASCPEDVFGMSVPVNRGYRTLANSLHPDHNPQQRDTASAAFDLLQKIHKAAIEHLGMGCYGEKIPFEWKKPVVIGKYRCDPNPECLAFASRFVLRGRNAFLRVPYSSDDNDLLKAESEALTAMDGIIGDVRNGIPKLLDSFQLSGKWSRTVNVVESFPGFISFEEIKRRAGAVDPQTAVWMFKRGLVLLGWVNNLGYLHGSVVPCHLLAYPDNDNGTGLDSRKHSLRLTEWVYSVKTTRTRISTIISQFEKLYAPELLDRKIHKTSDMFMLGQSVRWVAGSLPEPLENIIERVLDKNPDKRYSDYKVVMDAWVKAAEKVFGQPKYHKFIVGD